MSETEHLPNSPPLAGQGESSPKVRVLEFVGVEQRQLGFPPRLRAGLAGVPASDELRHQLAGGLVVYRPMAGQYHLRAGDAEGIAQVGALVGPLARSWGGPKGAESETP